MTNYYSWLVTERTFAVKDPEAFKKELKAVGVHDEGYAGLSYEQEKDGTFWLGGYDASLHYYDEEKDEDVSIVPLIQKHIKEGEIAVFMSIGQEELRSVDGGVWVITSKNNLSDNLNSMSEKMVEQVTSKNNLSDNLNSMSEKMVEQVKGARCEDCGRELAQNDPQVRLEDDSVYCLRCGRARALRVKP